MTQYVDLINVLYRSLVHCKLPSTFSLLLRLKTRSECFPSEPSVCVHMSELCGDSSGCAPSLLSQLITPPLQTYLRLCGETILLRPTPPINFMVVKRPRLSLRSVYPKMRHEHGRCYSQRGSSLFVCFFSVRRLVFTFSF